jgi:hypothetical protein
MKQTQCGFRDAAGHRAVDLLVQLGPTLKVDIGFESVPNPKVVPNLAAKSVRALVDTGAVASCIDSVLAMSLQLPVIDQRNCSGIGGVTKVNMHLAQIYIPSLDHTLYGAFAGVELASGGQWHQALLGRTFLQPFNMVYDGPSGVVTISDPAPNVAAVADNRTD